MLRFSPTAWAKLQYFCHKGDTEIGGFGVTSPDDPLCIEAFVTVKQAVTTVSVDFDDEAVADYFEQQVDAGRAPQQFSRLWLHTHPGNSPSPSATDEETFARVFGRCDWAVMFILAEQGETYARLRFNTGPGGAVQLPVAVDYMMPFAGSDHEAWQAEYDANIHPIAMPALFDGRSHGDPSIIEPAFTHDDLWDEQSRLIAAAELEFDGYDDFEHWHESEMRS